MANMMRTWLLIWVISDVMIFKMNATQNSTQEINKYNNHSDSEIKTNSSIGNDDYDDESDETDHTGIILNLYHPDEPTTNDTDSKEEHTNRSIETAKPTKPPFMQFAFKHPDKLKKGSNDTYTTTTFGTPTNTTATTPTTTAPTTLATTTPTTLATTTSNSTTKTTKKPLIPAATVKPSIKHKKETKQKIIISSVPDCPPLDDADSMSQTELIKRLVHVCRYDRLERPVSYDSKNRRKPIRVHARAYIYFLQNLDVHDLKFDIYLLFQVRYVDSRLVFRELAPNRKQPIVGRTILRDSLWSPHIFIANARAANILGTTEKDVLTSVSPDGTVIISSRIQASLNCWMNLRMYPFDSQKCKTIFESWMYNSSELELKWEEASPITTSPELRFTEYELDEIWTNETIVHADLSNLRHGSFTGNYSSLSFTLHLTREMGCFLMDYFLPSIMIVSVSWVAFWLRSDAPQRITLGTSTMLSLITLNTAHSRTLPKVSYIKMSEVWFVTCCLFIFSSLIETALTNAIFRRNNKVDLKKANTIYILKSSFTPKPEHKDVNKTKSMENGVRNGAISPNMLTPPSTCFNRKNKNPENSTNNDKINNEQKQLTIHYSNHESIPSITKTQFVDDLVQVDSPSNTISDSIDPKHGWTTMTSQEIALWVDRRARIIFPFTFFVFNIVFWFIAYNF